jgi:hypothetical protein
MSGLFGQRAVVVGAGIGGLAAAGAFLVGGTGGSPRSEC